MENHSAVNYFFSYIDIVRYKHFFLYCFYYLCQFTSARILFSIFHYFFCFLSKWTRFLLLNPLQSEQNAIMRKDVWLQTTTTTKSKMKLFVVSCCLKILSCHCEIYRKSSRRYSALFKMLILLFFSGIFRPFEYRLKSN